MYTNINFKTKKVMKEAFAAGKQLYTYQPGGMFPGMKNGAATIEGPHFPAAHTWYARVLLKDGVIVRVLS
jgi:hypothetical protein